MRKKRNKRILKTRKEGGLPVVFLDPKQIVVWEGYCRCGNTIRVELWEVKDTESLTRICDSCKRELAIIFGDEFR